MGPPFQFLFPLQMHPSAAPLLPSEQELVLVQPLHSSSCSLHPTAAVMNYSLSSSTHDNEVKEESANALILELGNY